MVGAEMKSEDAYLDVLQNLEAAIISVYHNNPDLLDRQVDRALELLIRVYRAQQIDRSMRPPRMTAAVQQVYDHVKGIADWRLGEEVFEGGPMMDGDAALKLDEIIACLERIRKSIDRWTKLHGRQGYLNFVEGYVSGEAGPEGA
jgi:hypothetical protein